MTDQPSQTSGTVAIGVILAVLLGLFACAIAWMPPKVAEPACTCEDLDREPVATRDELGQLAVELRRAIVDLRKENADLKKQVNAGRPAITLVGYRDFNWVDNGSEGLTCILKVVPEPGTWGCMASFSLDGPYEDTKWYVEGVSLVTPDGARCDTNPENSPSSTPGCSKWQWKGVLRFGHMTEFYIGVELASHEGKGIRSVLRRDLDAGKVKVEFSTLPGNGEDCRCDYWKEPGGDCKCKQGAQENCDGSCCKPPAPTPADESLHHPALQPVEQIETPPADVSKQAPKFQSRIVKRRCRGRRCR